MTFALALLLIAQAAAPTLTPGIVGLDEVAARTKLGSPDVSRREGQGALWTYRKETCVLFVYFAAPPGEPLKVTGLSAGPRKAGETAPTVDVCLAKPKA